MEKFRQNVSIWSLWQRQLYCFLKTMHLEESWSIDIEALLCSKFWLGIVLAFCLHVTVLPSSSRATVSHSSDNRQNFFCFQLFFYFRVHFYNLSCNTCSSIMLRENSWTFYSKPFSTEILIKSIFYKKIPKNLDLPENLHDTWYGGSIKYHANFLEGLSF